MPGFHMIATIAKVVAVAVIAEKRKTRDRCKNRNSAIDIICMSSKVKAIWKSLITAIATIAEIEIFVSQRLRRSQSLLIAAVVDQGVSI